MLPLPMLFVSSLAAALLGIGCSPASEPIASPSAPAATSEPPSADDDAWFLAVVRQGGVQHCPAERIEWVHVRPLLGLIEVSGPGSQGIDRWLDAPVLARGRPGPRPAEAPAAEFEIDASRCPIPQMRSDWIQSPAGIIIDRGTHPPIEHFRASTVRPLSELTARHHADDVTVEFRNPLPFELTDLRLVMHYEGCYGKPGTTAEARQRERLAAGETWTERFAAIDEHDRGSEQRKGGPAAREHLATSVELLGTAGREATAPVYFDLDVALGRLGVDLECPQGTKN